MSASDVVFLLPGFLGFERALNFSHFADRVTSALRVTLEQQLKRPVPVVAIPKLPARSLAARQRAALATIAEHVEAIGGVERIHLVGYCVGGVDAYLLSCEQPLGGERWEDVVAPELDAARARIRSVITIASPHQGTCLASAKGAGALTRREMLRDPAGALHVAQLLPKLVSSAWSNLASDDLWSGLAREGRKIAHFAAELSRFQPLLPSLTPAAMEELHLKQRPVAGVRRASVAVLAGRTPDAEEDPFFEELSRRTAGPSTLGFGQKDPSVSAAREALRGALADPARVIKNERTQLPPRIEITTNDGVVNTCRQLMGAPERSELLAVVLADHFDVVGYYDRASGAPGHEREILSGLLRSGSSFRDEQFFSLYRKVGECIAEVASATRPRSADTSVAFSADEQTQAARPRGKRTRGGKPRDATP